MNVFRKLRARLKLLITWLYLFKRDVYELFLINAAMQSPRREDHQFVR